MHKDTYASHFRNTKNTCTVMIHMYIYKNVCHRHIGILFYIYKIYFDTDIYIQYNRICHFFMRITHL